MTLSSNSQTLRAVGQALENEHLEDFDLENHDGDFLVRGRPALPEGGEMLIREILRRLGQRGGLTELRYGPREIDRLEEEGRARRRNDSGMPDFYMLSQLSRSKRMRFPLSTSFSPKCICREALTAHPGVIRSGPSARERG